MSKLSTSVFGGAVAAVTLVTASSAVAAPSDREIGKALECDHGVETHEWDADKHRSYQDGIRVTARGGEGGYAAPGTYAKGEVLRGETAFVVPGNGSVKMWRGKEGANVYLPDSDGYLVTRWTDVKAGEKIAASANFGGTRTVEGVSNHVGSISGYVDGKNIAFEAGETSTGLVSVEFTTCKDAPKHESSDDNGNNGHVGGVSDTPEPDTPSVGL